MKAKILLITKTKKFDFIKEFKSIDDFNDYKDIKMSNTAKYIKYSLLLGGATQYTLPKTEYSKNRLSSNVSKFKEREQKVDNTVQKNSRNSQLALSGNNLINLSMTPAKSNKLIRFMNEKPLTQKEKKIIKSLLTVDKLSINQYDLIKDIENTVSRRKRVNNS
jgi:hypothetical protein